MTRQQTFQQTRKRLEAAGLPGQEARWLLALVLAQPETAPLDLRGPVSPQQAHQLENLLQQRLAGYPLQYLLGSVVFHDLTLEVRPGVLIPRPETEGLVALVLNLLPANPVQGVDVGSGSGAIALTLAHQRPLDRWLGHDISPVAVDLARHNARRLALERVQFSQTAYLGTLTGLDWVVSNPPYLPEGYRNQAPAELAYEPPEALYSGAQGLDMPRQLLTAALHALRPGGGLALELDPANIECLAEEAPGRGWIEVVVHQDLTGRQRYLTARKPG